MQNKVIAITGATSGIGLAAAKSLAQHGAVVLGVGRAKERCQQAERAIKEACPAAQVHFFLADLSSQTQTRALASQIRDWVEQHADGRLDVLVNNAGMVTNWYTATEDGYETQFAVNHLAPYLLTHELLPLLKHSTRGRVLTVSSGSHRNMRIRWKNMMLRRGYNTLTAYKQSKLANVMFSFEFNRRYAAKTGVMAYAVDPGLVHTDIGLKGTGGVVKWVWKLRGPTGASPEQGAETVVFLALENELEKPQAVYWKNCRPAAPSKYAQRQVEAARLWRLSARLCGLNGDAV